MDLEQLMLDLKYGNQQALSEIYEETKNSVYFTIYSVLKHKENTEDVMHDTYIKILTNIHKYESKGMSKAWVCRIARNLALDTYRKHKKTLPLAKYENTLVADEKKDNAYQDTIEIAQKVLTENELEAVLMYAAGGLSHKEISEILKKPYATVRWNYSNSIGKIKKYIEENGIILWKMKI